MTKQKDFFFITGMHRSGTSALAGSLSELGFDLGKNIMPPSFDNEKGFFENRTITELDEKILQHFSSSWDSLIELPKNWLQDDSVPYFLEQGKKIIAEEFDFESPDPVLIKDPRISLLLPYWVEVLKEFNTTPKIFIILRSPKEIALSLEKRNGISFNQSLLLWFRYISNLEIDSRLLKRTFLNYHDLLQHPAAILQKCTSELGLDITAKITTKEKEITTLVAPSLKHNNEVSFSSEIPKNLKKNFEDFHKLLFRLNSSNKDKSILSKIDTINQEIRSNINFYFAGTVNYSSFFAELILNKKNSSQNIIRKEVSKGSNEIHFSLSKFPSLDQLIFKPSNIISHIQLDRIFIKYNGKEDIIEPEKISSLLEHGQEYVFNKNEFISFNLSPYRNLEAIVFNITYINFNALAIQNIHKLGISIKEWFYKEQQDSSKETEKKIIQLDELIKEYQLKIDKKAKLLSEKDTMINKEKEKNKTLSKELSEIKISNSEKLEKAYSDIQKIEITNKDQLSRIQDQFQEILAKERDLLRNEFTLKEQDFYLNQYKDRLELQKNELDLIQAKNVDLEATNTKKSSELIVKNQETSQLQYKITLLESQISTFSKKEEALSLENKNLQKQILTSNEKNQKLSQLQYKITLLESQISTFSKKEEALSLENKNLQKQILTSNEKNQKLSQLQYKITLLESQISTFSKKEEALSLENKNLQKQILTSNEKNQESYLKDQKIKKLNTTIQEKNKNLDFFENLLQHLLEDLAVKDDSISENLTKINTVQENIQSLSKVLNQKDETIQHKIKELDALNNQFLNVSDNNQTQQTTIVLKNTQLETLKSLLQSSEELVHNQHNEISRLQESIFDLDKNYINLRSSLSFKTGLIVTAPFRWLYNLVNKDKPINQSKLWLWMQFLNSSVSQPSAFIKQINAKNIGTLRKAIQTESPDQIASNFKQLLKGESQRTHNKNTDTAILGISKIHQKSPPILSDALNETVTLSLSETSDNSNSIRPKVLYISPNLPDYDTSSGGKRATRMLELLAQDCDVYAYTKGAAQDKYIQKLSELGVIVLRTTDYNQIRRRIHYVDVIVYAWYYTYFDHNRFIQLYPDAKIIMDSVDVHWVRESRSIGIWEGLTEDMVEANKKREIESYKNADIVWAVTENDKNAILEEIPAADIRIVSNIHTHVTSQYEDSQNNNLLFIGGYNHYPNISAIKLLALEIFPKVKEHVPDATLTIAGANAPEEVQKLGDLPGVVYKGFIEEDELDELYRTSFATVSPLLAGAGIKGKICESIAYMTPVITNSIGNEGIDLENLQDGLISDDYNAMSNLIVRALKREFDFAEMTKNAQHKLHSLVGPEIVKHRMLSSILPEVSICIVTWNRLELLKRCIESIEGNTNYPYYKILVHSNGCEDGTQAYLKAASKINKRIIPILSKTNDVFVKPNNKMMMLYPDNDVLLLNNDTYVTPNWLTGLYQAAYSSSEIGIAGSKILYPDGRLQEFGSELYKNGSGRNIGKWDEQPNKAEYSKQTAVGYVSGCSMYIKRSTIKQIGVFDEQFHPCYCEDSDLCYTAWEHNIQTVVTPKSLIYHDEGGTSGTDTSKGFKRYQEVNFKKFLDKHRMNLDEIAEKIKGLN